MDVFWNGAPHPDPPPQGGREIFHRRRGKFRLDLLQSQVDVELFFGGQHPSPDQGLRPGATAGDVVADKPAVDVERSREPLDQRIRLFAEAPTPGLVAQCETFDIRLARTSQGSPAIWAAGPHSCWLKLRLCRPRISGKNSE